MHRTMKRFMAALLLLSLLLIPSWAYAADNRGCADSQTSTSCNISAYPSDPSQGTGGVSVNSLLPLFSGSFYSGNSCSSSSCSSDSCNSNSCNSNSCTSESCTSESCTSESCNINSYSDDSCSGDSCSIDSYSSEPSDNTSYGSFWESILAYLQNNSTYANLFSLKTASAPEQSAPQSTYSDTEQNTGNTQNTGTAQNTSTAQNSASGENNTSLSGYAAEVLTLVNQERAAEGLSALSADGKLTQAAGIRVKEITVSFSHTRPDGSSCFTALSEVGASYSRAGENLAIGQKTPEEVVKAWMASPGHRANIMNPNFRRIGIAITDGGANYGGYAWAQFFSD